MPTLHFLLYLVLFLLISDRQKEKSTGNRFSTVSNALHSLRMVGLEPTRGCPRKILSLVRLPFRHIRSRSEHLLLKPFYIIA